MYGLRRVATEGQEEYLFKHVLLQEAIYESLPGPRRVAEPLGSPVLDEKIRAALETTQQQRPSRVA